MSFIEEFKTFAVKGNLIDMAIGVVIGSAFGKVTSSFIDGIIMPLVGLLFQVGNLSMLTIHLGVNEKGEPNLIKLGEFISNSINFGILAFVMFVSIKLLNKLKSNSNV